MSQIDPKSGPTKIMKQQWLKHGNDNDDDEKLQKQLVLDFSYMLKRNNICSEFAMQIRKIGSYPQAFGVEERPSVDRWVCAFPGCRQTFVTPAGAYAELPPCPMSWNHHEILVVASSDEDAANDSADDSGGDAGEDHAGDGEGGGESAAKKPRHA